MAITFAVDDVAPAVDRLPTRRRADAAGEVLALGGDPDLPLIEHGATHPLLGAVHRAFAEHRPLVLSPDAVWLTIAQGVAQHVKLNAEELRPRLVRHAGRERLEVSWNGPMPTDATSWQPIVASFRHAVAAKVGDGRARLLECDFSTSSEVERVASQIVLMDVYAPYFDYYMMCICGIPEVTVLGTVEDWRSIRARIDVIAELDLLWWARELAWIPDRLVETAEGRPDAKFWQGIYKPKSAYGGDLVTGWIARLYPYLEAEGKAAYANPLLTISFGRVRSEDGISPRNILAAVSKVQVHCTGVEAFDVTLEGGVVGVTQDDAGRLAPVCGWALRRRRAEIGDVIDRIRADHAYEPGDQREREGAGEHLAFYAAIAETTVFGWRIRAADDHQRVGQLHRIIDLPDGSFLAYTERGPRRYVRCPAEAAPPPGHRPTREELDARPPYPIVARSFAELLQRLLDTEGSLDLPVLAHLDNDPVR